MKPKPHPSTWSRLSDTLPACVSPHLCQNCQSSRDISVWIEHDTKDQPERKFVILCLSCSGAILPAHPRLYSESPKNAPLPGLMALCFDCIHRNGSHCRCPDAKFNGGKGIEVVSEKPEVQAIAGSGAKNGRRFNRWDYAYSKPPRLCSGRKTK